jgi:hypothetical protein
MCVANGILISDVSIFFNVTNVIYILKRRRRRRKNRNKEASLCSFFRYFFRSFRVDAIIVVEAALEIPYRKENDSQKLGIHCSLRVIVYNGPN